MSLNKKYHAIYNCCKNEVLRYQVNKMCKICMLKITKC